MYKKILKSGLLALTCFSVLFFPFTVTALSDSQITLNNEVVQTSEIFTEKGLTKSLEECPCNCPFDGNTSNELCIPLCPMGDGGGGINKYYTYRALTPNFSASTTSGNAPLTVKFRDRTGSTMSRWLWDFGDGTTSTEQNPIHTYEREGTYSVSLVLGGGNTDSVTGSSLITSGAWAGYVSRGSFSFSSSTDVSTTKKDFITVYGSEQPKPESLLPLPQNKTISGKSVYKNVTLPLKNSTAGKK